MADAFCQSAAVLVTVSASLEVRAHAYGQSDDFANEYYASEVFAQDPRMPYHVSARPGAIYHDRSLYDVDAMMRDENVRHTIEKIGVAYQFGAALRLPHTTSGMLTLLGTQADGLASEAQLAAYRRLAPHIEQAAALGELVERNAATQHALIEALAIKADGVILLSSRGEPSFVNDAASAILARHDGLWWNAEGFVTRRGPETRRLRQLVRSASTAGRRGEAARPGGQMLVTRAAGLKPYVLRVLPVPASDRVLSAMSVACMIHIHDLAAVRLPSRLVLGEVFGLTEREADLAIELVRCASLAGAAANAGMALNTARNHLQGVFRKCGVATQAEAVQMLSRLA